MARRQEFPDPRDRSINEPTVILSKTKVLALYNQQNPEDKAKYVSESVRRWLEKDADTRGWSHINWHENQAVLTATLALNPAMS